MIEMHNSYPWSKVKGEIEDRPEIQNYAYIVYTPAMFRCPKGNAAEAVAEKLDKRLRDNLKDARNSLFGRFATFCLSLSL